MPSNKKLLQAAAGSAGGDPLYVEDVFSTYLYDGNSSTNVITNGIDLAGEGGLVWGKSRDNAFSHMLIDTVRGGDKGLSSNATSAEYDNNTMITSFNSNGFTLGSYLGLNYNGDNVASWTFRKAEKFFDVVTYTGTGSERTVSHSLGSVPRIMIIKRTNGTGGWWVYSKDWVDANSGSLGVALNLSNTDAGLTGYDTDFFWGANPTDSVFSVGTYGGTNGNNDTYVAYLFASDAGGFGDDEDENIIKCGSYIGNGNSNGPEVNLGFEPQFLMVRNTTGGNWVIADTMRSFGVEDMASLYPNSTAAESTIIAGKGITPTATGFKCIDGNATTNQNSASHIYIAIRRPMKTPESGTEVFTVDTPDSTSPPKYRSSFPVDMAWFRSNINSGGATDIAARLTGTKYLNTNATSAEANQNSYTWDFQNGWFNDQGTETNNRSWMFKRATGFMDVVAYTGTGVAKTETHNLGVAPELILVKKRDTTRAWAIYSKSIPINQYLTMPSPTAAATFSLWNDTAPTSSVFSIKTDGTVNASAGTYISYLFATLAGVSKVGSYNGADAANVDVDCGFSAGARFILIKRTNATGNWFYWDYQRGITAGNDPYLLLNATAAQVTNTDYIDPLSSGFTVTAGASFDGLNNVGGTYIFLAIA